jgi:predicted metal-dependent hydrolase
MLSVRAYLSRREYQAHREVARAFIVQRVAEISVLYGFSVGRITIKNQKTCWGSCSKKGNLNFNYKILFLPEEIANYIIVHEVCHLREFNHSQRFWDLVAQTVPNHRYLRHELKKSAIRLG